MTGRSLKSSVKLPEFGVVLAVIGSRFKPKEARNGSITHSRPHGSQGRRPRLTMVPFSEMYMSTGLAQGSFPEPYEHALKHGTKIIPVPQGY
jgi:hypothetical protein